MLDYWLGLLEVEEIVNNLVDNKNCFERMLHILTLPHN